MKTEFITKLSRSLNKIGYQAKKHSPEILIVTGIIGTVTSAVMACKATTKLNAILDESKEQLDSIHQAMEHPETLPEEYTKDDGKKDLALVYFQSTVKIVKLYAPAITLGILSLSAIITSNNIMRKRYVAISAAYTAVDKSFKEYRQRVVNRFGKEIDQELKHGVVEKEIKVKEIDPETGKEKTVKKTVKTIPQHSEFAVIYDDGCTGWTKDPAINKSFLIKQQAYANNVLQTRGYLFLNEVYDMLGIPRTKAGQIVGWVYNKDSEDSDSDNYVDFGIYDDTEDDEAKRRFINGYEKNILLDFNVDGNILDLM